MKRKLPVLLLAAAMVVGISSCGNPTTSGTTDDQTSNITDTTSQDTTSSSDDTSSTTSSDRYVSRIELAQVPTTTILSVGDTIDLQEYVTVHYDDGTTSHTDFTANVRTSTTVELGADGHTLTIISYGDIRVSIEAGDLTSNFTATAYSEIQKEVYEAMGDGVTNATFLLLDTTGQTPTEIARAYKDSTYYAYNYFAEVDGTFDVAVQSLTDTDGNKVGAYEGTANGDPADPETVITYTPGKFSWNNYRYGMTVANVGLGLTHETIEYVDQEGAPASMDVWTVNSAQQEEFLANALMLGLSGTGETVYMTAAMYDITMSTEETARVPGFDLLTQASNGELSYYGTMLITEIGTTSPQALVNSLTDPSKVPQVVEIDEVTTFVDQAATAQNYTLTSTTMLVDGTGAPYADASVLNAWETFFAQSRISFTTGTEVVQHTSNAILSTVTPSTGSLYGTNQMQWGAADSDGKFMVLQQYTNDKGELSHSADDYTAQLGYTGTNFWGTVSEAGVFSTLADSNSDEVMSTVEAVSKETNEGVTTINAVGGVFLTNIGGNAYYTLYGFSVFGSYEIQGDPTSPFHSMLESTDVVMELDATSLTIMLVVNGASIGLEGNLIASVVINQIGTTSVDLTDYKL